MVAHSYSYFGDTPYSSAPWRPSSTPGIHTGYPSQAVYVVRSPGPNHGATEFRVAFLEGNDLKKFRANWPHLDPAVKQYRFTGRPLHNKDQALDRARALVRSHCGDDEWPDGGIKVVETEQIFSAA
ncbi:MAG: hypothetical protein HYS26_01000 [Candidatus Kaiserbacteria bacterium]|nr:MAG: hypothetical protein HYS26_01000 [Candidatus Kaiserbacteria bacterium]